MHLLGDVGTGVVNDDRLGMGLSVDADARVGGDLPEARVEPCRRELDVDESGAGDGDLTGHVPEIELCFDLFGDGAGIGFLAGLFAQEFGETHGGVGLVIAEFVVLGDGNERIGIHAEGGGDGGPERSFQLRDKGRHTFSDDCRVSGDLDLRHSAGQFGCGGCNQMETGACYSRRIAFSTPSGSTAVTIIDMCDGHGAVQ